MPTRSDLPPEITVETIRTSGDWVERRPHGDLLRFRHIAGVISLRQIEPGGELQLWVNNTHLVKEDARQDHAAMRLPLQDGRIIPLIIITPLTLERYTDLMATLRPLVGMIVDAEPVAG